MATKIRPDAPYKEFAERLTKLRDDAGLTREELGSQIGVTGRTIINYENGERIPYGDTCVKMAAVFGITVDELLGVQKPEVEMSKAELIDDMGRIFGRKSAESAQMYIDGSHTLLAGGTLSEVDELDFISIMKKVILEAEVRAKQKYTPHRLRSPQWEEKISAQRTEVDKAIEREEASMSERAEKSSGDN